LSGIHNASKSKAAQPIIPADSLRRPLNSLAPMKAFHA
jgi:hypothetical protein